MRFGLKMLRYRAGSELCFLEGVLVLPTSKALPLLGEGSFTVFCLCRGAVAGRIPGDGSSGSNAAPGSCKDGGGRPLSDAASLPFGGLSMKLP